MSQNDFEIYLGCLIMMGIVKMPQMTSYWSHELRFSSIADRISRNMFQSINKYLHFNNYNNHCLDPNSQNYENENNMSVDETIIPFKGRNSLKQYLPKKPKKWRFNVISRCGVSGIVYDFHFYDGCPLKVSSLCGFILGDFVIKLCKTLSDNQQFHFFFGN